MVDAIILAFLVVIANFFVVLVGFLVVTTLAFLVVTDALRVTFFVVAAGVPFLVVACRANLRRITSESDSDSIHLKWIERYRKIKGN